MRKGGDRRGSAKNRRARKHWMLAHFDPELGPDLVRCRLMLDERCYGILDFHLLTAERIDRQGPYTRENTVPACHPCQRLQGGLSTLVRFMGPLIEEYRAVREQWEIRFDLETNQSYYPGVIEVEQRRERRGGRREVTDWLEENPPPVFREWLEEWHAARREQAS